MGNLYDAGVPRLKALCSIPPISQRSGLVGVKCRRCRVVLMDGIRCWLNKDGPYCMTCVEVVRLGLGMTRLRELADLVSVWEDRKVCPQYHPDEPFDAEKAFEEVKALVQKSLAE